MNAVVAYESVYGNTRANAQAIAEGLRGATGKAAAGNVGDRSTQEVRR